MDEKNMTLSGHFGELRKTILAIISFLVISSVVVFFTASEHIYHLLTQPLRELDVPIIATRVTEIFLAKIKLSFWGGLVISFPVLTWQTLSFILPGLTKRERYWLYFLIPAALLLCAGGIAFAYLVVFPLSLKFLLLMLAGDLTALITIREYLTFTITLFVAFGLLFQLPIVVAILSGMDLLTPELLNQKRKHSIVGIFIVAAILTGPDVISQILLALPLLFLYEISAGLSYLIQRRRKKSIITN